MSGPMLRRVVLGAVVLLLATSGATLASASSLGLTSKALGGAALSVAISTVTLTSTADTYTAQSTATTNFGTATTTRIASQNAANQRTFVKFDLSAIPSTARVQVATLQLTMSTAPSATRTYEVDRATATWSETTLTWNTMPAAAAATASVVSGTVSGVNLTWNVKSDVSSFVGATATNFGWQLKDTVESSATARTGIFSSREFGTASQRPTLTVIYAT